MSRKLTNEEFKERAYSVHGNKYNYDKTIYIDCKTKVDIFCNIHKKYFSQTPSDHLSGCGCKWCKNDKLCNIKISNTEEFIKKAKIIHGNKYGYSKVNYKDAYTKVDIFCNIHKEYFKQQPTNHLSGQGCKLCKSDKTHNRCISTTEEFIKKARKIHGNIYSYDKVDYINVYTRVEIFCNIHKKYFWQKAHNHLAGSGCKLCKADKLHDRLISNTEEFIERAEKIHLNKYNYDKVKYVSSQSKVEIICPIHGSFLQEPNNHIFGQGCPSCSHMISKPETLWLDSLNLPNDKEHRHVSIKINGKLFKPDGFDPITNTIYEFYGDYYHGNPSKFQPDKINPTVHKTFGELYLKTLEKETILKSAGYNVISIWESDFKANNL